MVNVKVEKTRKTKYGDMQMGDLFSWPVHSPRSNRATGLKLDKGFVWIRDVSGREMFIVGDEEGGPRDLSSKQLVEFEGTLQITLEDE